MKRISPCLAVLAGLILSQSALAGADDPLPTLEKGMEQAKRSGQAILYVTKWKPGV